MSSQCTVDIKHCFLDNYHKITSFKMCFREAVFINVYCISHKQTTLPLLSNYI